MNDEFDDDLFNPWRYGMRSRCVSKDFLENVMKHKKKAKKERQLLLMVGLDGYPWEAFHLNKDMSDEHVLEARKNLQEQFPNHEVRLCEYHIITMDTPKVEPYKRIKKLKHIVKSSAEWIKEGERTAICGECGAVGPSVPMTGEGNRILHKAGWYKSSVEAKEDGFFSRMMGPFGGNNPSFILRCPSCDEQIANKDTREDWFV